MKKNTYFIGIGGIGMSSLARYFHHQGAQVAGYDLTPSPLTEALQAEGIQIHYTDSTEAIPTPFLDKETTRVVYTPAVPKTHSELCYFQREGFEVVKRSQMLGVVSADKYVMAVAGTHGKTTTSTMLAHFNHYAAVNKDGSIGGGSGFLGGISKNFGSNLVLGRGERLAVEADEFDRSFLQLYPNVALVTSVDADHLDIYNDHNALKQAFSDFVSQIKPTGAVVYRKGIELNIRNKAIKSYTYAYNEPCDFYAKSIVRQADGHYKFDIVCPDRVIEGCRLGIPGWVNVENCIGAVALMWFAGFDEAALKTAIDSFSGVKRRFDIYLNTPKIIYMDDYAHHPKELEATITSIRQIFPEKRMTIVFQPHLFTRTRDFAEGFSKSLSLADKVLLLPIYPARELPIEGVSSELIFKNITTQKQLIEKTELLEALKDSDSEIIITFGAGDIDRFCTPVAEMLKEKYNLNEETV